MKRGFFTFSRGILSSCNTNSIRLSLLKWLHDDEDEDSDQQNVENWNELKRLYPDEIAKLLCAITLKKCPRSFVINDEPLSKNLDPNEIFILETNIIKMPDKSLITPLKIEDAKFALPRYVH